MVLDQAHGDGWTMYQADCIEAVDGLPDGSVHLSVFSPPFPAMYMYTGGSRDVSNTESIADLVAHFGFLMAPDKLLRATMPGRLCVVHLMQIPSYSTRDGVIGIQDFRGPVIAMAQSHGWAYASEVTIDKDPQVQATRHKEHGLLFKTLATDSTRLRAGLADYLLVFRAPGDNPVPVRAGNTARYSPDSGWVTEQDWVEWAAPVWYRQTDGRPGGVRETDVLDVRPGRADDDERHVCPLQLGVSERVIRLYSNPGETVLSPFAGIGSEGVSALRTGRRFVGIELKESYYRTACRNLAQTRAQPDLFAEAAG